VVFWAAEFQPACNRCRSSRSSVSESRPPLVHGETLKMHKQGGFRRGWPVSVCIDLAGNRSLGEDGGECLRMGLWGSRYLTVAHTPEL